MSSRLSGRRVLPSLWDPFRVPGVWTFLNARWHRFQWRLSPACGAAESSPGRQPWELVRQRFSPACGRQKTPVRENRPRESASRPLPVRKRAEAVAHGHSKVGCVSFAPQAGLGRGSGFPRADALGYFLSPRKRGLFRAPARARVEELATLGAKQGWARRSRGVHRLETCATQA